jgi:hypothetical protein
LNNKGLAGDATLRLGRTSAVVLPREGLELVSFFTGSFYDAKTIESVLGRMKTWKGLKKTPWRIVEGQKKDH